MSLDNVKQIVLVLSGKGGVGKTTISTSIALSLVSKGFKVGLLDIDLTGPSVPYILSLINEPINQSSEGWIPIKKGTNNEFSIMSLGFLLPNKDDPVIWRGPKKTAMVNNLINNVVWGDLDYLIIDTPPGTSDEHISIMEQIRNINKPKGSIIVTTPQGISISDVKKEINFCEKLNLPIYGIIENMSGYICPHCSDCSNIFSKGGGEKLANDNNYTYLGSIPIDPKSTLELESKGWINEFKNSSFAPLFSNILQKAKLIE